MEEEREGREDEWTGVTDDRDKKALLINHQLNKRMSSQSEAREEDKCPIKINRKKREESEYWDWR